MADDIIDLAQRRHARALIAEGGKAVDGYRVAHEGGAVEIAFVVGGEEYVITMPRDDARRFGMRVCLAAKRSLQCQLPQSSPR